MKKLLLFITLIFLSSNIGFTADVYTKEYLQSKRHFAIANHPAESFAEKTIKNALKKETGGDYKVKFKGYTLSSMKQGIFKYLEITGENVTSEGIPLPYVHVKSISDYNYVDYTKNPMVFRSDMEFEYDILLSSESLNQALKSSNYQAVIENINKFAGPVIIIKGVSTKIADNRLYIMTEYNFPIALSAKNKVFVASSNLAVQNGKIKAVDVKLDSAHGISVSKIANLLNLLNPLEFTMEILGSKQCNANIENVNIVDNNIKVSGKIFVKGD